MTTDLVAAFAESTGHVQARETAQPLLTSTNAALASKDKRFAEALRRWTILVQKGDEQAALPSLALIWRLTSLSSMALERRRLVSTLSNGIAPLSMPIGTLEDPKDRKAASEAIATLPKERWVTAYCAAAIMNDPDPKSDARDALCNALLIHSGDLTSAFAELAEAASSISINQSDVATGRARRLAWVIRSLRSPLLENDEISVDESLGESYSHFVLRTLGNSSPTDFSATIDASREALQCLSSIIRLHGITIATSPNTYTVINHIKRRFSSTDWPDELHTAVEKIARQLLSAIIFLAKQGIADSDLRRSYTQLVGDVVAKQRLKRAAEGTVSISADLSYWLQNGSAREKLESEAAIEESSVAQIDKDLARIFLQAAMIGESYSEPEFDEGFYRLKTGIRDIARKRGLNLRGMVGDVTDFSPAEHVLPASDIGARRVILASPLVEKISNGQRVSVMLKAEVLAFDGGASE